MAMIRRRMRLFTILQAWGASDQLVLALYKALVFWPDAVRWDWRLRRLQARRIR